MRTEHQITSDLEFERQALKAARQAADFGTLHGFERFNEAIYRVERLESELALLLEQNERALLAPLVEQAAAFYSLCQERGLSRRQAVSMLEGVMS
jgi:hypothetical protein